MAEKIEEILASLLLPADSDWQVESFENYFFQLLTFGDFTYITMKLNKTKKKNEKETKKSYSCLQALIG